MEADWMVEAMSITGFDIVDNIVVIVAEWTIRILRAES